MANTASAKKAVRQTQKRTLRNLTKKKVVKERLKAAQAAIVEKKEDVQKALSAAQKALDKAAKKNTIHKNKAARLQSRLQKKANAAKKK